jgi:hypothetical protein
MPAKVGGFREYRLRIETGDEGLWTEIMRHKAGGDADGAIGPEDKGGRRDGSQNRRPGDEADQDFPRSHGRLPAPDRRVPDRVLARLPDLANGKAAPAVELARRRVEGARAAPALTEASRSIAPRP